MSGARIIFSRTPILPIVLSLLAGISLAHESWIPFVGVFLFLAYFLFISGWGHRTLLCLLLGVTLFFHRQEVETLNGGHESISSYYSLPIKSGRAKVCEVSDTKLGYQFILKLLDGETKLQGTPDKLPQNLYLIAFSRQEAFPGEVITFRGKTIVQNDTHNFGAYDWDKARQRQGYAGVIRIDELSSLKRSEWRTWLYNVRKRLTTHMVKNMRKGVSEESSAYHLVPALILGKQPPNDFSKNYQNAGVMHMLVVSGLHVGIVVSAIWGVLYFTPLSSRGIILCSLTVAWGYAWLSGFNPPVVRVALVLTVYVSGFLFKLRSSALNSLLFAFAIILLLERFAVYKAGVWMSFCVVAFLIISTKSLVSLCSRYFEPDSYLPKELWSRFQAFRLHSAKRILGVVIVSVVAWGTSSVLTAFFFERVYLYGAMSSLLLLPITFLMVVLGGASACMTGILPVIGLWLNQGNVNLSRYADEIVSRVNVAPARVVHLNEFGYSEGITVFSLPKSSSCILIPGLEATIVDAGSEYNAKSVVHPILERIGLQVLTVYCSHVDTNHSAGEYPGAEVHNLSDLPPLQTMVNGYLLESFPISVKNSIRSDDHVALVRISKNGFSLGYISDAGCEVFEELERCDLEFRCDVLVASHNANGEDVLEDFLHYTGADHLVIGMSYDKLPLMNREGIHSYDQRECGAVRVQLNEAGVRVLTAR